MHPQCAGTKQHSNRYSQELHQWSTSRRLCGSLSTQHHLIQNTGQGRNLSPRNYVKGSHVPPVLQHTQPITKERWYNAKWPAFTHTKITILSQILSWIFESSILRGSKKLWWSKNSTTNFTGDACKHEILWVLLRNTAMKDSEMCGGQLFYVGCQNGAELKQMSFCPHSSAVTFI